MSAEYVACRAYIDGGWRCALVAIGPKWVRAAVVGAGGRVYVVRELRAQWRSKPLPGYPDATTLAQRLRKCRRLRDITKGARAILAAAEGMS